MKAFAPLFVLMPLSFCSAQFGLSPDLRAFYPMNGDAFNAQGDFENHALYVNATYGSDAQSEIGRASCRERV